MGYGEITEHGLSHGEFRSFVNTSASPNISEVDTIVGDDRNDGACLQDMCVDLQNDAHSDFAENNADNFFRSMNDANEPLYPGGESISKMIIFVEAD